MYFDKENMLIAMYPEDAIYKLTVKHLSEKEQYNIPEENKPFSFKCVVSEDDAQDDLLARLINHLCRKCNHAKYNSLANRICIGKLILFLLQRDNNYSPDLASISQKLDDMQSKETPDKFVFTDISFDKKNPKDTLTQMLADFMRITTGDVSPKRRGSFVRTLSSTGTQLKEAVRDASPFKSASRSRRGSIVSPPSSAPPAPSPTPATSSSTSTIAIVPLSSSKPPALSAEESQTNDERQPLLTRSAAATRQQSSPPKAPQGHGAFFQQGELNNPQDPVNIFQSSELKTKQTAFTTSYEKPRDIMTIWCANTELSQLLERKLKNYIDVTRFNDSRNIIQFIYRDLISQKLNLNMILPIVFRGLPEALEKSAKGDMLQRTHSIKKDSPTSINDDDSTPDNNEKKSRCCGWLPCC